MNNEIYYTNELNTAEGMYRSAYDNDLVGWPGILFPMKILARKSFEVIERKCLVSNNDEVLFTFMMLADTNMFNNNSSRGPMNAGPNVGGYYGTGQNGYYEQQPNERLHRHWTAFALTKRASTTHLYYARWVPFNSDYGDMPVSSNDLNIDVDMKLLPLHSKMDISTLRKGFMNMTNKRRAIEFIRRTVLDTLDSVNRHKDSEDGRRIYDQYSSQDQFANEEDQNEF